MDLRGLPKIELHCHLDGSVRLATVRRLGEELGMDLPSPLEDAMIAPPVCADVMDYLERLQPAIAVMQRVEDLTRIARELVEDFANDGVIYGEIRFAPQLHQRRGLSLQQILDAVATGLREGENRFGIRTGLILCCLRQQDPAVSLEVAALAADNRDKVCALDLAGDEAGFAGADHAPAFALAIRAGLHRTVHAGEGAGSHRIREAIDLLSAERIGHGVRIVEDPSLMETVRRRGIPLEICPHSNVQTCAVASYAAHPVGDLLRDGLRVTVNTDDRTPSATSLTREFEDLFALKQWTLEEFRLCQQNAAEAAFASEPVRRELRERINDESI